jgi:hypothetical protein
VVPGVPVEEAEQVATRLGVNDLVLMQNQHLTPSTQQAERSWLNTRAESKACQSIFLKLTKDKKAVR